TGSLEPVALDSDRGRARDRDVHERLDDHLAAAEEDHRGHEGDRRERGPGPGGDASVGAARVSGLANERLAFAPDALLHGRGEPLPDLQRRDQVAADSPLSAISYQRGSSCRAARFVSGLIVRSTTLISGLI